ncbi:MAG: site-2 protease family protein [Oscillospiraceae bacterium]|nr:site-2 protease family protein [Oscillospiraceae bacterium]
MLSFGEVIKNLDWSYLVKLLLSVIPALVCVSFHEMCHGLAAYALGDKTAKSQGRISMNPLRHIDPIGLLMLVLFKFGWAKPVSVDMRRFRRPKLGMAATALAGPVSNFVLAVFVLFVRGVLTWWLYDKGWGKTVLELLDVTAYLSVGLGIFNFIPIPPLDGSKVLFSLLPDSAYMKLMRYERYGMILLIVLALTGVISRPLGAASEFVFDGLFSFAQWGFKLIAIIAGR